MFNQGLEGSGGVGEVITLELLVVSGGLVETLGCGSLAVAAGLPNNPASKPTATKNLKYDKFFNFLSTCNFTGVITHFYLLLTLNQIAAKDPSQCLFHVFFL